MLTKVEETSIKWVKEGMKVISWPIENISIEIETTQAKRKGTE